MKCAVSKAKKGKAAGEGGVMVEMLEALGGFALRSITALASQIHIEGAKTL